MKTSSTNPDSRPIESTVNYVKEMFLTAPDTKTGKTLELGVNALLAKTALRRLPPPLNFVVPLVVKNVIVKHGVPEGRELLLKGLRWVKKKTDDTPPSLA
ncbi:hypothetical protein [Dyadobacter sp. CY326]|uniref:hypothetical protein n=1 Tax=Dyadobacter sp. CY326 TaxID=2907300 RepID=UPI001F1CE104|nr:hypothetical protein [Dyadobacter sp. CY326]MCE7064415.1 hypothetical protein [Dyadobacter sp. CY326]